MSMGVYIKGMEMPTSCWECPMVSGYEIADEVRTRCSTVRCRLTNTKRPVGEAIAPECPLVLVPPHGRLIDADAFLALVNDSTILSDFLKCIISPLIRGEPTVIEAEEGE